MDEQIHKYIKNNKKTMGKIDFDSFIESDEFYELNDDSKRIIFFMVTLIMSTQEYKNFNIIIKDFTRIIGFIKENKYLEKTHESYDTLLCNYLKKIQKLSFDISDNQDELIKDLGDFSEEITKIYFPQNNANIKPKIIKYLLEIKKQLNSNKDNIDKTNITKYERYCNNINNYIKSIEGNNNINEYQFNSNKSLDLLENNNNIINNNNYFQKENKKYYNTNNNNYNDNKNYNIINNNNQNNNIKYYNNLNSQNEILNNNSQNFNIIYNNNLSRNNNNKNINNFDSIIVLNPQKNINSLNYNNSQINNNYSNNYSEEEDDNEEEEEKLQSKYEEVDNFIDDIIPFFNSNESSKEEINNLKKQLNIEVEDKDISINNSQISNSQNSSSNSNKKKKKKKKKSKANKNQNNNNINQNPNYPIFIQPNIQNIQNIPNIGMVGYPPFVIQPGMILNPNYLQQIPGINNNNYNFQNQYYPMLINNNFVSHQNQNLMNKKIKKKK